MFYREIMIERLSIEANYTGTRLQFLTENLLTPNSPVSSKHQDFFIAHRSRWRPLTSSKVIAAEYTRPQLRIADTGHLVLPSPSPPPPPPPSPSLAIPPEGW